MGTPPSAVEHQLTPELAAAIEHLYEVFAGHRLCHPEPCAHCYPAAEVARTGERLRSVPLRELTLVDLHHFYTDGVLTWGDADDLRYLLPRLMEVYVHHWESDETDDLPFEVTYGLDAYFALGRLVDGGWRTWPDVEREAVERFLWELWRAYLAAQDLEPLERGSWTDTGFLGGVLLVVPDAWPYLAHWLGAGAGALRHLAWFIRREEAEGPFWEPDEDGEGGNPLAQSQVRAWLASPDVPAALTAAARDPANRRIAWEYVLGLEVLRRGREAVRFGWGTWLPDDESRHAAWALGVDLDGTIPRRVHAPWRPIPGLPYWAVRGRERLVHRVADDPRVPSRGMPVAATVAVGWRRLHRLRA